MKLVRSRLTYANVVATLALFVALGGASYAAFKLPKNSVGTRQIKNGAVTGAKIRKGAVTATSIAPGAITQAAINPATLGTVPSATNAAHAATADTATNAANAGNAATVGGQTPAQIAAASKLRCPSGTIAAAGYCLEEAVRANDSLFAAIDTCGDADRSLAPEAALRSLLTRVHAREPEVEIAREWAGQLYSSGAGFVGEVQSVEEVSQDDIEVTIGSDKAAANHNFRCATLPSN